MKMAMNSSSSSAVSWIALISATPVVLVLLTFSISRQRHHVEKHVLSTNVSKYIILLKTVLSLLLSIQFTIFIYSLLYKLLSVENYAFIFIFTIETLRLVKSLISLSLVIVNSMSLSKSFVSYHIGLLFLLSASIHVPILLNQLTDLSDMDYKLFTYYVSVHCVVVISCFGMVLSGIFKCFCKRCSNVGCEQTCSCSWSPKTCICLMVTCILLSDAVFVISLLLEQYPQYHIMISNMNFDHSSAILWSQVIEGVCIVILVDPVSQSICSARKHQIRLVESPTSSYNLSSDGRINNNNNNRSRGGGGNNQGIKFPITNGSLFATMVAMRGRYNMGGFDLKSAQEVDSRDNTFDKFKTYTKDIDFEESHSVTTICNDEFDFELPISTKNNNNNQKNLEHGAYPDPCYINYRNSKEHQQQQQQQQESKDSSPSSTHVSLNLYESASMNDLDSAHHQSCHNTTRLYKKNSKFKNDKKVFRRIKSAENLSSAGVLIISDVNDEWI